ncbi:hypothetical protein J6590_039222 [Homalodisca vitripennis]|nr:hypothetical protein J6590_039222 [Homalodisca vitripennis]
MFQKISLTEPIFHCQTVKPGLLKPQGLPRTRPSPRGISYTRKSIVAHTPGDNVICLIRTQSEQLGRHKKGKLVREGITFSRTHATATALPGKVFLGFVKNFTQQYDCVSETLASTSHLNVLPLASEHDQNNTTKSNVQKSFDALRIIRPQTACENVEQRNCISFSRCLHLAKVVYKKA